MQIRLIVTGLILALTTMTSGAAEAQRPQSLGVFTDWQAFQAVEGNGQLVCFIASKPTNSQGDYTRRGPIWLLVAHRPGVQTKVVSMEAGFHSNQTRTLLQQSVLAVLPCSPSGKRAGFPR